MSIEPQPAERAPAVGDRVVMRYRLPEGYPQPLTDVLGELVSVEPPTVRTADGALVEVAPDKIVALRVIPARPIRTSEIRALEYAGAAGWPGVEQTWLDGWLLRAGHGYTHRANSALPLGDSSGPAIVGKDTLHRIGAWYTEHGLPVQLCLPDRLAATPPGWHTWNETVVLGIDIATMVLPQGPSMVRVSPAPSQAWLELYRYRGGIPDPLATPPPRPAPEVLNAVRDGALGFAVLGVPQPIAVARGAVTTAPDGRRWVGLSCVAVATEHRRHGLGALICAELLRWGQERGAGYAYVQVAADNPDGLGLFREMGFVEHHRYRYAAPRHS